MHYVELDQFIGERYLVTVHGPLNPALDQAAAMVEVDTVLRLHSGKLKPDTACELSYALLTALTGRLRTYPELTKDVWKLEQRVTGGHLAPGRGCRPSSRRGPVRPPPTSIAGGMLVSAVAQLDVLDHRPPYRHPAAHAIASHCARRFLALRFLTLDKPETLSENDVRPSSTSYTPTEVSEEPILATILP